MKSVRVATMKIVRVTTKKRVIVTEGAVVEGQRKKEKTREKPENELGQSGRGK